MTEHVRDRFASSAPLPPICLEPRQFRLTENPHSGAIHLGRFWISYSQELPLIPVTDSSGTPSGALLGFPIDLTTSKLVQDCWVAPPDADLDTEGGQHAALMALGGSFLWICTTRNSARIYPDAAAQVGCVWDKATRSAGATALAILDEADYVTRFDHTQFARLRLEGEGWFPAGLTAHSGVTRLPPNHYLDLGDWEARRFDIRPGAETQRTTESCISDIIETVQSQIIALLALPTRCAMALTAGYHTRTLLACARPWIDQMSFFTVDGSGRLNADPVMARQIALDFNLTHQTLPKVAATRQQQETYLRRSGHCIADGYLRRHASLCALETEFTIIGGTGGAVGTATDDRTPATTVPLEAEQAVLAQLGMRGSDKTRRHMRQWIAALGDKTQDQVKDLAYIEQYLAPSAMPKFYAHPTISRFSPFITYRGFAQTLALPKDMRMENGVARAVITRLWPELGQYPINTIGRPSGAVGQADGTRASRSATAGL